MGNYTSAVASDGETDEMKQYLSELPSKNLEPLWSQMSMMVPPSPNPTAKPHMWTYKEALPHLETAAKLVPEEKAERRVLMLVNPSMRKCAILFVVLHHTYTNRIPLYYRHHLWWATNRQPR
jgi:gentisate 1,2-dioxygenase